MRSKLLTLLALLFPLALFADKTPYISKYKEEYTINQTNGGFNKNIHVTGAFKENTYTGDIYFGELEKVESLSATIKSQKGKIKKVNKDKIFQSDVYTRSFYQGYKTQKIEFTKTNTTDSIQYFAYKANIYNKELMCLTRLLFFEYKEEIIDTIQYLIHVPKGYKLIINQNDIKSSDSIKIDSVINADEIIYQFTKHNLKADYSYTSTKEPILKNKFSGIRFLLLPTNENPFLYFNAWYQNLIEKIPISEKYKSVCDSLSLQAKNKDSLIKSAYRYVTQKIKYLDIENGLNAFIPRKCDDVLLAQQGDCKDMAFLLYNMYTYLGFDAHIALSSTLSHDFELDFPSLSSANHSICILDYNGTRYYLDATEFNGLYNIPSRQIQNTKALISKKNTYELISIPYQPLEFNKSEFNYTLRIDPSKTQGEFHNTYNGYARLNLEDITKKYSKNKSQQILSKYLQRNNFNLIYNSISYEDLNNKLNLNGNITLSSSNITKVENQYYLNLSFLPYAHSLESNADTTENLVFYSTTNNTFKVVIEFPEKVSKISSTYKEFNVKDENIEFNFKITYSANKLFIDYSYINPYVKLLPEKVKHYNQTNQLINSVLNHEIIIN